MENVQILFLCMPLKCEGFRKYYILTSTFSFQVRKIRDIVLYLNVSTIGWYPCKLKWVFIINLYFYLSNISVIIEQKQCKGFGRNFSEDRHF